MANMIPTVAPRATPSTLRLVVAMTAVAAMAIAAVTSAGT
jgi:hypothetical protein